MWHLSKYFPASNTQSVTQDNLSAGWDVMLTVHSVLISTEMTLPMEKEQTCM